MQPHFLKKQSKHIDHANSDTGQLVNEAE